MEARELRERLGQPEPLERRRLGRDHAERAVQAALLAVDVGAEAAEAGEGPGDTPGGDADSGDGSSGSAGDDRVVDADFEEVDDDKKGKTA